MPEGRLTRTRASLPAGYRFGDMQTECWFCGFALWLGGDHPECVSPFCEPRPPHTTGSFGAPPLEPFRPEPDDFMARYGQPATDKLRAEFDAAWLKAFCPAADERAALDLLHAGEPDFTVQEFFDAAAQVTGDYHRACGCRATAIERGCRQYLACQQHADAWDAWYTGSLLKKF